MDIRDIILESKDELLVRQDEIKYWPLNVMSRTQQSHSDMRPIVRNVLTLRDQDRALSKVSPVIYVTLALAGMAQMSEGRLEHIISTSRDFMKPCASGSPVAFLRRGQARRSKATSPRLGKITEDREFSCS